MACRAGRPETAGQDSAAGQTEAEQSFYVDILDSLANASGPSTTLSVRRLDEQSGEFEQLTLTFDTTWKKDLKGGSPLLRKRRPPLFRQSRPRATRQSRRHYHYRNWYRHGDKVYGQVLSGVSGGKNRSDRNQPPQGGRLRSRDGYADELFRQ